MRIQQVFPFLVLLPVLCFVTGCAANFTPDTLTDEPEVIQGQPLSGLTYGGQSPITGAHLYLFAASASGYGAASVSLIQTCNSSCNSSYPSQSDGTNNYIVTGPGGAYSLVRAQYSCTVGQQVYLYTVGGNPGNSGGQTNSAAGEMAILGTCISTGSGLSLVAANSFVYENEVSTVAAAYAMAGFAVDAKHVGSSGTTLAQTNIQNAFNNSVNLYNIGGSAIGLARSTTPAGNGTVPEAEINSLANSLAACVNSTGPTSTTCSTLLNDAKSGGTSGTNPSDTATAAINIAHNPWANVSSIWGLAGSSPPFASPILASAPNDWNIGINFTDSTLLSPQGVAIDASGNAWITDYNGPGVTKLSPLGVVTGSITDGSAQAYGFESPYGIAIDMYGNAWVADSGGAVIELSSNFVVLSGSTGYINDASYEPIGIAIDAGGNAWVGQQASTILEFSNSGADLTSDAGWTGSGLADSYGVAIDAGNNALVVNYATKGGAYKFSQSGSVTSTAHGYGYSLSQKNPTAIAMDNANNVWMVNGSSNSVSEFTDTGTSSIDCPGTGCSGGSGGLSAPTRISIDGASRAWITNGTNTISELALVSGAIVAITPSAGYRGAAGTSGTTSLSNPQGIAVDGSGDVWVANNTSGTGMVTEFIGAATPVVTPLVESICGSTCGSAYSAPASKP